MLFFTVVIVVNCIIVVRLTFYSTYAVRNDFADGEDNLPGPGVYLRGEDPVLGTPMQHYSELRAQTIEKAAYYLDVALGARNSSPESHMLYTLHVYQYTVPTGSSAGNDNDDL